MARIKNNPTYYKAYQQSLPLVATLKELLPIAQNQLSGIKKSQLRRTDHQRVFVPKPKIVTALQPKQLVAGMAALDQEERGVETQIVGRALTSLNSFGNRVVQAG